MKRFLLLALALLLIAAASNLQAQAPSAPPQLDEAAIRTAIAAQVAAWNRADIPAFMQGYDDSPETAFVSPHGVERGFQPILDRYRKAYATQEQMGKLTFSDLNIRLLPSSTGTVEYAIVTGRFSPRGGIGIVVTAEHGGKK